MSKHAKKTTPSRRKAKPLPRTRENLTHLLHALRDVLKFYEKYLHRQEMRLAATKRGLQDPVGLKTRAPFFRKIAESGQAEWAHGVPSLDFLLTYIDPAQFRERKKQRDQAHSSLAAEAKARPINLQGCRPMVNALEDLVHSETALIALLQDLQRRVMAALEEHHDADSDSDNKKTKRRAMPENIRVLELARRINAEGGDGRSKKQIAMEFTKRNKKDAESLLRQVRRFPNLLNR